MGNADEGLREVLGRDEPGDRYILATDPPLRTFLCLEHVDQVRAGALWLLRPMLGGQIAIHVEGSLPMRLVKLLKEGTFGSRGPLSPGPAAGH